MSKLGADLCTPSCVHLLETDHDQIAVSLMESLVTILKDELVTAARKSPEMFQADDGHPITDAEPFDIDVGDFFDVLSGAKSACLAANVLLFIAV